MEKLRLFEIKVGNEHTKEYFSNKIEAKQRRNSMLTDGKTATITPGPDHRKRQK